MSQCDYLFYLSLKSIQTHKAQTTHAYLIFSNQACPFVIEVYCQDVKATQQPVQLDSGIKMLNSAVQRSITSKAEAKSLKGHESVLVYTYKGESRISSVIANKVCMSVRGY